MKVMRAGPTGSFGARAVPSCAAKQQPMVVRSTALGYFASIVYTFRFPVAEPAVVDIEAKLPITKPAVCAHRTRLDGEVAEDVVSALSLGGEANSEMLTL